MKFLWLSRQSLVEVLLLDKFIRIVLFNGSYSSALNVVGEKTNKCFHLAGI